MYLLLVPSVRPRPIVVVAHIHLNYRHIEKRGTRTVSSFFSNYITSIRKTKMSSSASSALVNVAEDAELRLVRLLADAAESTRPGFIEDCEACIVHGDAAQLMRTILSEQNAISALISLEEEAVSAVSLLAALLAVFAGCFGWLART